MIVSFSKSREVGLSEGVQDPHISPRRKSYIMKNHMHRNVNARLTLVSTDKELAFLSSSGLPGRDEPYSEELFIEKSKDTAQLFSPGG